MQLSSQFVWPVPEAGFMWVLARPAEEDSTRINTFSGSWVRNRLPVERVLTPAEADAFDYDGMYDREIRKAVISRALPAEGGVPASDVAREQIEARPFLIPRAAPLVK